MVIENNGTKRDSPGRCSAWTARMSMATDVRDGFTD